MFDERLGGALKIEISGTVYDAIKGKIKTVTVGDKQSFVSTSLPNLLFDIGGNPIEPVPVERLEPVIDSDFAFCYDSTGEQIFERTVF